MFICLINQTSSFNLLFIGWRQVEKGAAHAMEKSAMEGHRTSSGASALCLSQITLHT